MWDREEPMDPAAAIPPAGEPVVPPAGRTSSLHFLNRVVFGAGAVDRLGELARALKTSRALVVTDPGVRAAGHAERAARSLWREKVQPFVFDGVDENPTTRHVEEGSRFAGAQRVDLIVGLGGGSAMDTAKGINFLLTNGGRMEDYWGSDLAQRPMLPSLGVPTTAGTGSEAQSYALIEQEGSRVKMACGDRKARFHAVVLDPDLTATAPRRVTAAAGMDAVGHAVESYVTARGDARSRSFAAGAWKLLEESFEGSLAADPGLEVRGRMLLGAHLAGVAIELSMLGAAHACANPLTSRYEVAHGAAVLLLLPHVIRYNEPAAAALYSELWGIVPPERRAGALADRIEAMRRAGGLPGRLRDVPVPPEVLPDLAREAAQQWTATFNPRPVTEADLLGLYEAAF